MSSNESSKTRFLYELARDSETSELIDYMKHSEEPVVRARAAEILGDFSDIPQEIRYEEVVRGLITTAVDEEDDRVRAIAIDSLYRHGEESLERLIDELSDRDIRDAPDWVIAETLVDWLDAGHPEFRLVAATALTDYGDETVVPDLLDLFDDPDARVRQRAVRSCGLIGDDRCVDPLRERLDDSRGTVRTEAAHALANLASERALEALIPIARANDEELRHIAVEALGGFENLKPLVVLIRALSDRSGVVRRAAAISLIELFADTPSETAQAIRGTVVDQLEHVESVDAVPVLIDILEISRRWRIRRNAVWLLGHLATEEHDEAVFDALIDVLDSDDPISTELASAAVLELADSLDDDLLKKKLLLSVHDERTTERARRRAEYLVDQISPDVESELVTTGVEYTYVREPADYTRKKRNERA